MIWNFPRFFRVFSPAGGIFRNSEPVWCPHSFLCLLFPGKGKRTAFSFCFSKKKTPDKRKETGENFRMVSPDPFYRPEPCSGLAAYGSRRIYDRLCRGRCRAQLFATKERYRCGLPLAGTHRPASAILHRAIVFECRGGRLCPPAKAPSASEEACCIPFPPGRRKLHIRSLLLPSQIVTVSLGHNLAVGNFTTPHAILMMAGI